MYKNVASQKIAIYAHDTAADAPKTGDAANITAYLSKDGGAAAQTNDVNPTELDATNMKGIYIFDMLQAETNANMLILSAVSSTSDIQIEPVIIYTDGLAQVIDGDIDAVECLKILLAVLAGDIAKSTNTYTYDEQDGTVKVTEVVSADAVERTIA